MRSRSVRMAALIASLATAPTGAAWAADALPEPVAGISFEEWAAGNTRIGDGVPESEIRAALAASAADWKAADDVFNRSVETEPPGGAVTRRYAEVMNDPNVGRFAKPGHPLAVKATLGGFDDYARIRGQLAAALGSGTDLLDVLSGNGLTHEDWARLDNAWTLLHHGYDPSDPNQQRAFLDREATLRAYETRFREEGHTEERLE